MNYEEIEKLVSKAKLGDEVAKETLVVEFTPFILNLAKKSHINSYDFSDIKNECYKTLFKCVQLCDTNKHRFVAYTTNAIKNSVNNLIRISIRRSSAEGPTAYVLDNKLENILSSDFDDIDDLLLNEAYKGKLKNALKNLDPSQLELITYVYYKKYTLKQYAEMKGIAYSTLVKRRNRILDKLKAELNIREDRRYLN